MFASGVTVCFIYTICGDSSGVRHNSSCEKIGATIFMNIINQRLVYPYDIALQSQLKINFF